MLGGSTRWPGPRGSGRDSGVHSLDGDETVEAEVARFVDRSHASFGNLLEKLIGADAFAGHVLVSCGNPGSSSCLRPDDHGLGGA